MNHFPFGFEEDDGLRSDFIRELTLRQLSQADDRVAATPDSEGGIPRRLVRYWHDIEDLPDDVRACLDSWDRLREHGFEFHMFDDATAARYIAARYGPQEVAAFARCRHPAMRSDYLRMCFILAEGGLYVDADDVLLNDGWTRLFTNNRMKVQPLCYDILTQGMVSASEIWRPDLPTTGRIFYVNNDPLVAPAGHPVIRRALVRATKSLLGHDPRPEIQSTTGPGNLTAVLAAHAHELGNFNLPRDFELLHDWEAIAETRWNLSYRNDARNWRNMDAT